MHNIKLADLHLRIFYADNTISLRTHQLIKKLPAFISTDPNEKCHFYIRPNTRTTPLLPRHGTAHEENLLGGRYRSRTQKMLLTAQNVIQTESDSHQSTITDPTEDTLKLLQQQNPLVHTFSETEITSIIANHVHHCETDDVLNGMQRLKTPNNKISFFLLDKFGIFKADEGYHIEFSATFTLMWRLHFLFDDNLQASWRCFISEVIMAWITGALCS